MGSLHWRVAPVGASLLSLCALAGALIQGVVPEAVHGYVAAACGVVVVLGAAGLGAVAWFAPKRDASPPPW